MSRQLRRLLRSAMSPKDVRHRRRQSADFHRL